MSSGVTSESLSPSALQAQKHLLARGMCMTLSVLESRFGTLENEVRTVHYSQNTFIDRKCMYIGKFLNICYFDRVWLMLVKIKASPNTRHVKTK